MTATRLSLAGELAQPVASGATAVYTTQFLDENGVPIPAADLLTLTLSITDPGTGAIVNGADQVNILNTGRGAVDAQGNLTLSLLSDDTLITGTLRGVRSLVFEWTWGANRTGKHEVVFPIMALSV